MLDAKKQEERDCAMAARWWRGLGRIPEERRTKAVRRAALGCSGMALQFIAPERQTAQEAALAVRSACEAVFFVRPDLFESRSVRKALEDYDPMDEQAQDALAFVQTRLAELHAPDAGADVSPAL